MTNIIQEDFDFTTDRGKDYLKGLLHATYLQVTFTKKDGTERKMRCTLLEQAIPEDKRPKTEGSSFTDEAVRVFDMEKQEWRAFRFDSIKNVTFSPNK